MTDPGFEQNLDELKRLAARLTLDLTTLSTRIAELERRAAGPEEDEGSESLVPDDVPPIGVSEEGQGTVPPVSPPFPVCSSDGKPVPWAVPTAEVPESGDQSDELEPVELLRNLLDDAPAVEPGSLPPHTPSKLSSWDLRRLKTTGAGDQEAGEGARGAATGRDEAAELVIGRTWLNRAGAVILLLAFFFLVKYSFDQGWISPTLRVLAGAVAGIGLIGVGEFCLHRDMRSFATGVLGCGVGLLYLAVFGAYNFYELVGANTAGLLFTGVTLVAVAVSVHGNMLPVAVLGVIGGYATPIALSTGTNAQVQLLTYVLFLDVGFLICGTLRKWDVLRSLAWLGTAGLFSLWAIEYYDSAARWVTWGFLLGFYVLFHVEALVSTRRGWALWTRLTAAIVHADNVVFFAASYYLLREAIPAWLGLFAVVTAGVQWLSAWRLVGREQTSERVRLALWLNGAAMLALAAPLQFDRYMVSVSWSVQAVVTLWFCRRYSSTWLQVKGVGVLVAAVVHLYCFEYRDPELTKTVFDIGRWTFSWSVGLFALSALCAYGGTAVLLIKRVASGSQRDLAVALIVGGTALLLWLFCDQWERFVASWWWLGLTVAWWLVAWRVPRTGPLPYVLTFALVLKFFCWDTLGWGGNAWTTVQGIGLNRAVATGLALVALAVSVRPLSRKLPDWLVPDSELAAPPNVLAFTAALLVSWTGAFEIARIFGFENWAKATFDHPHDARGVFITAFWALQAGIMWAMGGTRRQAVAHYALLLTILVVFKTMLFDTAMTTASEWRHLSGAFCNRTFLVGVLVIALAQWAYWHIRRSLAVGPFGLFVDMLRVVMLVLVVLLTVWIPTFEIARVFEFEPLRLDFEDPRLAMHLAMSVYWGVNATVCLMLGFARRVAVLRYLALGLYGVTVVKVFLFDLARLETVYRIISFMVLGVLLLFASLLYQRLAGRIGEANAADGKGDRR